MITINVYVIFWKIWMIFPWEMICISKYMSLMLTWHITPPPPPTFVSFLSSFYHIIRYRKETKKESHEQYEIYSTKLSWRECVCMRSRQWWRKWGKCFLRRRQKKSSFINHQFDSISLFWWEMRGKEKKLTRKNYEMCLSISHSITTRSSFNFTIHHSLTKWSYFRYY